MTVTPRELDAWLKAPEDEHLELKEARNRFDFEELVRYCAALANEGGGRIVLGVTDKRPRQVVGSRAFPDLERTKAGLVERLHLRIEADSLKHRGGRVVVFSVPARPLGMPIQYRGAYWMRSGEALMPMTQDRLQAIFAEAVPDFSAEICSAARLEDLDSVAIEHFRRRWQEASGNAVLAQLSVTQLLEDAELLDDGRLTYAALILLGTRKALGRHLAQTEVIFEYRSNDASIRYQQRKEYREGFLLFHDELWKTINLRNDVFSYLDGLFRREVPTFNEDAVREAILNAVEHRDYRMAGSVFVRQWPRRAEITSPGGFPEGVTAENILWRQNPRNRRIAEAFARCGLVERSGQGVNCMFAASVREGKLPPDFSDSDEYQVGVTLHGQVSDPLFLQFLEKVGAETQASFTTADLVVLDAVHRERPVPERVRNRLSPLCERGILERVGRRYMLSQRFYDFAGKKGIYTRKRGLNRETNKALLLKHIEDNRTTGSPFEEFEQILPGLSRSRITVLLRELRRDGRIHVLGRTKAARWFPGAGPEKARGNDAEQDE